MRSSQTQPLPCLQSQPPKPSKYPQLKQLQYLKQLLRKNEDIHLKQILPMYINKYLIKQFDHDKYIYLPEKNNQEYQLKCGIPVDTGIKEIGKKVVVYCMDRKIQDILKFVFMVNVPVLARLKAMERFTLLMVSQLQNFVFNRHIYNKGQQFTGIYFIIDGQVKIIDQKHNNPLRILHKHAFIGLHQLCNDLSTYHNTIVSNSNNTKVLYIQSSKINIDPQHEHQSHINKNLKEMFIQYYEKQKQNKENMCKKYRSVDQEKEKEREREKEKEDEGKNGRVKLRNYGKDSWDIGRYSLLEEKNDKSKQKLRQKQRKNMKVNMFVKKWDDFVKTKQVEDIGFDQFMKSRKMMIQLRNSMSSARLNKLQRSKNQNMSAQRIEPLNLKKSNRINSNITSNRSQLYKQRLLKRLQFSKCLNFNNCQITKVLSESILIEGNLKK